jgi:Flp pilus assembly protein TadD
LRNQLRQARQRGDRKALEAVAASVGVGQLPPESLLQLTTALNENGAKEEAMALARRALLVHPGDFWLNNYLGWWCLKAQPPQYDDAIRYYTASWSLRPRNPYTVNALGDALAGKKAYTEAISLFSRAIELKPDYAQAWILRGSAYRALHQYDKALADVNKAIELDANNALLRNNLAWFLATCPETKLRDASRAVALAQKAVALAPKAGMIWNTLGAAHYRAGNCKEALAALEKSMELRNGGNSFDWFFLAMTYWQLGEKEKSRAWFDRAVQWMDKNQPKDEELGRFREEAEELLQIKKK